MSARRWRPYRIGFGQPTALQALGLNGYEALVSLPRSFGQQPVWQSWPCELHSTDVLTGIVGQPTAAGAEHGLVQGPGFPPRQDASACATCRIVVGRPTHSDED